MKVTVKSFLVWLGLIAFAAVSTSFGFKTEFQDSLSSSEDAIPVLQRLEAGLITSNHLPPALLHLGKGEYEKALSLLSPKEEASFPWLRSYLEGLVDASASLVPFESEHFVLWLPPDQTFLKEYTLPILEKIATRLNRLFNHKPKEKIRVEVYPTKEDFSKASTLTMETLKRSGAIGICKFHRLMILSPRALPTGYRWMDALAHEYGHLMINEVSWAKTELWLHEGTARYFDTSYRADPPLHLSPNQKTKLLEAQEEDRLVSFKRMSPSLVYLKDQDEVSLAFSQVSHAIQVLIETHGIKKFMSFLKGMKKRSFPKSFQKVYGKGPFEYEDEWKEHLKNEKWEKTKGAMSDEVRFDGIDENKEIGASVKGKVRLGDKMRRKKLYFAALLEYNKALEEEPDNALILLKSARTHLLLEQKEEAIQKLRRAVKSNPNYVTPYVELAKWVGDKEAIEALQTAVAINPFNPLVHRLLADRYTNVGKKSAAALEEKILSLLISR